MEGNASPTSPELESRIKRYLLFRVLVTVLGFLLVTFYLACLSPETRDATGAYLYSLLAGYLGVGILFQATFPRWRRNPRIYRLQVLVDFAFQAVLVYSTGGVVSIFCPILFVTLAAATGVASPRESSLLATLAVTFLAGTTIAYWSGKVPATSTWSTWIFAGERSASVASYLLANVLGLYVISALGSKLSSGLLHAEHLQEAILENMVEGLIAVDEAGRVLQCNSEARKLLGLEGDGVSCRKRQLAEVFDEAMSADAATSEGLRKIRDAFSSDRKKRFEVQIQGVDGEMRPAEVKISSVTDDKNRLKCRVGLIADLTLKREVEQAERRIQKLEELQVMAMGIAHEIRNPLASIRGCVQEIAKHCAPNPIDTRYAEIVMRESDRLDRILEDFLRYARSAPVERVVVDFAGIVDEAVSLLERRSDAGTRTISWQRPRGKLQVEGDRDRLLQVILNLGINALQATEPGEGTVAFEIVERPFPCLDWSPSPAADDEARMGVELRVRDNGGGMPAEVLSKVFTPFFTTKCEGTGLGLSIVDRIVREHGGLIDIQTVEGEGTSVLVRFPLLVPVDEADFCMSLEAVRAAEVVCDV